MNSPLCSSIINNKGDICDLSPVQAAAAELNQTDVVVVAVPMWNYTVPHPLKQYIDAVVQPGLNFSDVSFSEPQPWDNGGTR